MIKREVNDDITPVPIPSSGIINEDYHDKDDGDEDEDEIIREIPVYISSNKHHDLHLIQWPLMPAEVHDRNQRKYEMFRHSFDCQTQRKVSQDLAMVPDSARVRVKHEMLELDYNTGNFYDGDHGSQVYESNAVPAQSHLAIGRWSDDGESIHLTPLAGTYQVRPSFRHFDEKVMPTVEETIAAGKRREKQSAAATIQSKAKPIMFKKKESERAIAARKNSYAYKRDSEESEDWLELDVCGTTDANFQSLKQSYLCSPSDSRTQLTTIKSTTNKTSNSNGNDSSANINQSASLRYMKSLCYLPNACATDVNDSADVTVPVKVEL